MVSPTLAERDKYSPYGMPVQSNTRYTHICTTWGIKLKPVRLLAFLKVGSLCYITVYKIKISTYCWKIWLEMLSRVYYTSISSSFLIDCPYYKKSQIRTVKKGDLKIK